jgi:hypothetical protein
MWSSFLRLHNHDMNFYAARQFVAHWCAVVTPAPHDNAPHAGCTSSCMCGCSLHGCYMIIIMFHVVDHHHVPTWFIMNWLVAKRRCWAVYTIYVLRKSGVCSEQALPQVGKAQVGFFDCCWSQTSEVLSG